MCAAIGFDGFVPRPEESSMLRERRAQIADESISELELLRKKGALRIAPFASCS
jgi:hypothetical protein